MLLPHVQTYLVDPVCGPKVFRKSVARSFGNRPLLLLTPFGLLDTTAWLFASAECVSTLQHSSKAESQSYDAAKETGPNANIGKVEGVYEGGRSQNQGPNLLDKTQESAYNKMPTSNGSNQTGTGQGQMGTGQGQMGTGQGQMGTGQGQMSTGQGQMGMGQGSQGAY